MALKVYFDLLSQPSRALLIFLENCNIPHEKCPIALRNGEHLTDEYKNEISRFQRVPAIKHGDFKLAESIAIVRYLSRTFNVNNNWYPTESKAQARVDEYLEWQHLGLRMPCVNYFRMRLMSSDHSPKVEETMLKAVNSFEKLWLNNDSLYITGNQISIADIFAACELEQPRFFGYNLGDGRPILSRWWTNVRNAPHYKEVHTVFNNLSEKMIGKMAKL